MFAIVKIGGQQYKVQKDQFVYVNRLDAKEGSDIELEEVLMIDNSGKVALGMPSVDGASVSAKILSHLQGDKVLIFKKKRRKGYQKMNGHRQALTKIQISAINEKGGKAKKVAKKEEPTAE